MDSVHSANKKQQIKWPGQAVAVAVGGGCKHLGDGREVIDSSCLSHTNQEIKA